MPKPAFLSLIAIASIPFIITLETPLLIQSCRSSNGRVSISLSIQPDHYRLIQLLPLCSFLWPVCCLTGGEEKVILPSLAISGAGGIICGLASLFGSKPFYLILLGRLVRAWGRQGFSHALSLAETSSQGRG